MVTHTLRSAAIATLACVLAVAPTSIDALEVGEYFRPSPAEASAFANTTAMFSRSPCPGLNSLANHGHLPRDGRNISHAVLKEALMSVYNLADDAASILVSQVPDPIALDYLGTHNLLEHDASLAHADYFYGADPMTVNMPLAEDLFSRADEGGMINSTAVARTRKDRAELCEAENPECIFDLKAKKTAFLEAAVLVLAMGVGDAVSEAHARSFIVDEHIPDDYVKPAVPITFPQLQTKMSALIAESEL